MLLGYYTALPLITAVSVALPCYGTFKALQSKSEAALTRHLSYWLIFALVTTVEFFLDTVGAFLPFYYEAKLAFFLWLVLERTDGASKLYAKMEPLLKTYEPEVDKAIASGLAYAKNVKIEDVTKVIDFVHEKVGKQAAAAPKAVEKPTAPTAKKAEDEQTEKPAEAPEVVQHEEAKKEQ